MNNTNGMFEVVETIVPVRSRYSGDEPPESIRTNPNFKSSYSKCFKKNKIVHCRSIENTYTYENRFSNITKNFSTTDLGDIKVPIMNTLQIYAG